MKKTIFTSAANKSVATSTSHHIHFPLRCFLFILLGILLTSCQCCLSIEIERTFLSGVADTTQIIHPNINNEHATAKAKLLKRHHLVCFHKQGWQTYNRNPHTTANIVEGRKKCCSELYQNGLLASDDDRKYCLDHVAVVPPPNIILEHGDALPAFYLAHDKAEFDNNDSATKMKGASNYYKQSRQLKVLDEDKERDFLWDGPNQGVGAFSPFHLTGFTSTVPTLSGIDVLTSSPLRGHVKGTLSEEGGMHRAFRQTVNLSLDVLPDSSSNSYKVETNATILLPISESIFIDADDALLVEYDGSSPEGTSCKVSTNTNRKYSSSNNPFISSSKCNIQFIHPETINIEQPSFASRQYVVAYHINAMLEVVIPASSTVPYANESIDGELSSLDITIDYGTTLHIRYPSPILASDDSEAATNGLVPILIQQPVLYSASASLQVNNNNNEIDENDESSNGLWYYALPIDATNSTFKEQHDESSNAPPHPPLPVLEPILIHVAAGVDGDNWWVTVITMSSALMGGLVLMRSLDSVSLWI